MLVSDKNFNNIKIHTQYSICEGALRTSDLAKYCKENQIKAVVVQHTFGIPANIVQILETCNKREIPIIEDCCHSINTKFQEKYLGDWSQASFYSFSLIIVNISYKLIFYLAICF